jgi:trimeric autotransporter adhesin
MSKKLKSCITFFLNSLFIILMASCSQQTQQTTISENEENDKYDGPEMIARMEFERTKDPATGRVPREQLMVAMDETELSKTNYLNRAGITALSWIERGPTSDLPGTSNGNTRANSGIAAGRIRALMVDSTDATKKTVWAGSVAGGLWKTTDITVSPANWILVNDYLSNLSIADICQDPRPGFQNIMYFCTGESYFNFDAVQGNGVFKSIDGGATWNYLASTSTYVSSTRIKCDFQGNIYLATRGTGLLRSTAASGGASWTNITPTGLVTDICDMEISSTAVAARLHIVAGVFSTQAYRYTDIPATVTSATWTTPTTAFPSFATRAEIACSGSTLYALPGDGSYQIPTIYKSINGGATWVATGGQPTAGWASQGWYALSVDIDPSNVNNCIVGGLDTWKTINGGTNWTQISNWVGTAGQYVHADVHKILWYDGGNKLLFGSDGGVFYSADKGTTIRDRNNGLRIKQFFSCAIHPTLTDYFLAGAQDNGVHQFNNAGLSNTVEVTGGDGAFVAIDQNQPQFQFGSYVFSNLKRSTDGGVSWSGIAEHGVNSGLFINPFDYDDVNNIMYMSSGPDYNLQGVGNDTYARWDNPQTGSTFTDITIPAFNTTATARARVSAVKVSPYTNNTVYFGTTGGRVVKVANANIASPTATNITGTINAGYISNIEVGTDDNNLIVTVSNYGVNNIYVTTNGGATWVACDGNLPNMPVRWALFYPADNSKMYIATETGVWETGLLNGAATVWTANNTFPNVRTDMIKYRPLDRTIAAATHGRGLWTTVLPTVTTPDIQFQGAILSSTEVTAFTSGCRGYKDYTANMVILNAPTGTATVTVGIAAGATALQSVDYAITTNGSFTTPSNTLTFASAVTTPQPITIRIYDDAAIENAETFTLNYTISGATNAQAGTSNQTLVYTINDNDVAPIASGTSTNSVGLYEANAASQTPFRSDQAKFRIQTLFSASELMAAGITTARNFNSMTIRIVTKNSTQPYTNFTISMANTSVNSLSTGFAGGTFTTVYPAANYSSVVGDNSFNFSTPFAWDGVSNVLINYCFDNVTAIASADVTEATIAPLGVGIRASTYSNAVASAPCTAAAAFISDARIRATFGTSITGTTISTALNNTKNVYLGPNDDVYFYDAAGAILARIKNLSAFDYGCTQVTIDRAGTGTTQFWNSSTPSNLLQKTIKVVPTNNTTTGNYQITLYYTGTEVANWQTATGLNFSTAQVVKVSNGFFVPDVTPASPHVSDVTLVGGTATAFGTNFTITGNFTSTGFSGFGVGVPGNPISTANFRTKANGNFSDPLIWEYNSSGAIYVAATQAPGPNNNVTIQAGHIVALNASFVSNATKSVTVAGELNCSLNTIAGAGDFVLTSGATLGIGSTSGINTTGTLGNIQTVGRTFSTTANYAYNGGTSQVTGTALPLTIANLILANTGVASDNIVMLNNNLTVSGNSTLTSGILSIGTNTIVLTGAATYSNGLFRGSVNSNMQLAGNVGEIRFDQSSIPNRTLNSLTVGGIASLGSLNLIVNNFTVTPFGNFTTLTGNNLQVN